MTAGIYDINIEELQNRIFRIALQTIVEADTYEPIEFWAPQIAEAALNEANKLERTAS